MRIAIVDDLTNERAKLKEKLEICLYRRSIQAEIFEYENGEVFLEAAKATKFTVAFLDIYMSGINGIETAKELRKSDTECLLIFTTTSPDHALEGFRVRALHYLVKPFTEEDIEALVKEILDRVPKPPQYITLKANGSEIRVCHRDIVYAEHFAHLIYVHTTAQKTLTTRQPFKVFAAPLRENESFFVCGRGVIVNLEHAADLEESDFLMDDGSRVPVSQELLKSARQAFMEYLLQKRRPLS